MATIQSGNSASPYKRCADSLRALMERPPKSHGGVFTEIDVVRMTDWDDRDFKEVARQANQVCGGQYRARNLCRYGPVVLADGSMDYARVGSKIVYADAEKGPEVWETPNGSFPRLMVEADEIAHQGRRAHIERNDAQPWEEQPGVLDNGKIKLPPVPKRRRVLPGLDNAEVIENLRERIEALEEAERRRREIYAQPVV